MTVYLPDHEFALCDIQRRVIEGPHSVEERIAILKWMQTEENLRIQNQEVSFAVTGEVAIWLHENISGIRMKLVVGSESSLEYAQWVITHKDRYEIEGIATFMTEVIYNGNVKCLSWLLEISPEERLPSHLFNIVPNISEVDL